jgi:xanthine dehydrogenase YagS FAD-binding subunit
MNQFQYVRPAEVSGATKAIVKDANAWFLAGGTNLIDLMKMGVVVPERLVDINLLPLKKIEKIPGGVRIGALASNTEVSEHSLIKENFPLLSLAINAGASPQLRNMATVGGNLLQRTRCPYFFDTTMPCNKRVPGSGCGALAGYNRMHALFGASDQCIAVNPSDMNVALRALDATVRVTGKGGERTIKIADFHRLPGDKPQLDNTLQKGELVTAVDLPDSPYQQNVQYLKIRDRTSYAFALVSVAAGLNISDNTIQGARLAMGGVAHKPWRLTETEAFLKGKPVRLDVFQQAAQMAMEGARAYEHNKFKLKMGPNAIVQVLKTASGLKA